MASQQKTGGSVVLADLYSKELAEFLSHCPTNAKSQLMQVLVALKRGKLFGPHPCAKATLEILRAVLGHAKFTTTEQMMHIIRLIGFELHNVSPCEFTMANVVKRVLFIIREEYAQKKRASEAETPTNARRERSGSINVTRDFNSSNNNSNSSKNSNKDAFQDLMTLFTPQFSDMSKENLSDMSNSMGAKMRFDPTFSQRETDFSRMFPDMRQSVMTQIIELNDELDTMYGPISEQAQEHIHADECVLTHGHSHVIELFLKAAARKRRFQVIVAEGAPSLSGHRLAQSLSRVPNISVSLIPDSNVYAIMSRINKVLLSPHAVMANGGAIGECGHGMVAIAAKEYSVPVMCVTGNFLITPLFPHSSQIAALSQRASPGTAFVSGGQAGDRDVAVPGYDYIEPEFVDLYVTNNGCHLPSYVYRLLSEYYHPADYDIVV